MVMQRISARVRRGRPQPDLATRPPALNTVRMATSPPSTLLTIDQAFRLLASLEPHAEYLRRLRDRVQEKRFPADDPIRAAAEEVCEAMQRLADAARASALRGKSKRSRGY